MYYNESDLDREFSGNLSIKISNGIKNCTLKGSITNIIVTAEILEGSTKIGALSNCVINNTSVSGNIVDISGNKLGSLIQGKISGDTITSKIKDNFDNIIGDLLIINPIVVPGNNYNTVIINDMDDSYKNNLLKLKEKGYLIFNVSMSNSETPKLIIDGGTIVFNNTCDIKTIVKNNNNLTLDYSNCDIIINENVMVYCGENKGDILNIKRIYNYGNLLINNETSFNNNDYSSTIFNTGTIRIRKPCEITGDTTNTGMFLIYNDIKYKNGRFSNDENGILNLETNGIITYDISKSSSHDYIIQNLGGLINIKEEGKLIVKEKTENIKYLIKNNHILKFDGEIINNSGKELEILNNINSIIYLENDANISENIKFVNNDNIISFKSNDKIKLQNEEKGRYLNIPELYYNKGNENKYFDIEKMDDLINYIYELNSSDIDPDVLNTISFLLLNNVYRKSNIDISEILKLLKLYGFLHLPGYSQLKKQII